MKNKTNSKQKIYRVTYRTCTDIENDYLADNKTNAKALFCRENCLPVKYFIDRLKVRVIKKKS